MFRITTIRSVDSKLVLIVSAKQVKMVLIIIKILIEKNTYIFEYFLLKMLEPTRKKNNRIMCWVKGSSNWIMHMIALTAVKMIKWNDCYVCPNIYLPTDVQAPTSPWTVTSIKNVRELYDDQGYRVTHLFTLKYWTKEIFSPSKLITI